MKKLPVAVMCPQDCFESSGKQCFEKGKKYKITSVAGLGGFWAYSELLERSVCLLWRGCSFLDIGLEWIPVYELEEEGQMEFQFE